MDMTLHLHTEECQKLIIEYVKCHERKPIGKFFGGCNAANLLARKCMRNERLEKGKQALEKSSKDTKRKLQETNAKPRAQYF